MELSKQELSAIEILTWEVDGLEVIDKTSCELAQGLRNKCNERIKSIKGFCKEAIQTAHKAHKAAKAQESTFLVPVETLQGILTKKLKRYADEEMEKERAAQRKLDEMRQEAAEDGRQEVLPQVSVQSTLGKGWRDSWAWEVVNETAVPSEYWILDEKTIAAEVRDKKDKCNIPGIKVTKTKIPVLSR